MVVAPVGGGGVPVEQVLAVAYTQFTQGMQITLPFTIAVYMIRNFEAGGSISEQRVSRLTGLLAAVYSSAQACTPARRPACRPAQRLLHDTLDGTPARHACTLRAFVFPLRALARNEAAPRPPTCFCHLSLPRRDESLCLKWRPASVTW